MTGIGTIAAGRRQGQGRRDPDRRPRRRHRRLAPDLDQVRRPAVGDGPVRGPPGADAEQPAPPRARCAPTAACAPAATSSSPPCWAPRSSASAPRRLIAMGCIMVRQCHSNTCPVGVCTQDERAARQVHRHAREGRQPVQLHRRGGARDPGLAGLRARCDEVIGRTDLLAPGLAAAASTWTTST